jgi:hypothetical protein
MKPEGSFLHSQAPVTFPYIKPDQSSPCLPIPRLEDPFNIILPSPPRPFPQISPPKHCTHLSCPAHLIFLDLMTRIIKMPEGLIKYREIISANCEIISHAYVQLISLCIVFFSMPPHVPYGPRGLPSRLWPKCNRLLRVGRP